MAQFDFELVGKIGSMALIRREDHDIDYNIFSRLGASLRPGMIWVSSGATEIGRLDYMRRNGGLQIDGNIEEAKADYAAQGQAILMSNYRNFIDPRYSIRQVLVEHTHFNQVEKRAHIRGLLLRAASQNAIPIVNYNDTVSAEENRKLELASLRAQGRERIVECIDNDETAAVIAILVRARTLLILTSVEGIYRDPADPSTLVREIAGANVEEAEQNIRQMQRYCFGASREGAGGAYMKLEFAIEPVRMGTRVIIASAKYRIEEILDGRAPSTVIGVK